jgi:hypothetical protein
LDSQKLHEVYVPTNQAARHRKFLQADMAESPMVARAEILESKKCWSEQPYLPHPDSD